ncbi:acyl-ACP--UDP-N-acetylglucosamine O-acyltransferase [Nibricoccus sp. IMCC34717]|uniref:acyl-ACP--UDP-N-acetylglucosamine O-acyltransferase n=1 Tax=Nibricoccus sp. IMCC34717 TaxID=3034021 RepID=UPI0038507099
MSIHPTAIIEPGAVLGTDCEIHAHAVITRHAILSDRVVIHAGAVIGGDPQYLKFERGTESYVRVGTATVVREHVTLNRAVTSGASTVIGDNCFLMACSHVAHDCNVGDNVVLANNALLAGHVSVGNNAFIGGAAAVHQNVRVGQSVMVGGLARITRDLAPFTMVAERDEVSGLNLLGLKRRGFPREAVAEIKRAFREVYLAGGNPRARAERALASGAYLSAEARHFLQFFLDGKRGFARACHAAAQQDE